MAPQVGSATILRFRLVVSDSALTAEAFLNVTVNPAPTIYFPQFASGGGVTSDLVLTNATGSSVSGLIELFDDSGRQFLADFVGLGQQSRVSFIIPAFGSSTVRSTGQGGLASGFVRVTSTGNVGGVIRFSIPGVGVAGVGDSPVLSSAIVPVRRTSDGINTGIAIADATGSGASVTLTLRTSNGAQVASTTVGLPPNGHAAKFINEMFSSVDATFEGTVTIVAAGSARVSVIGLELGTVPGLFTTLPVTPLR
jgi:hypothetical protein